MRLAWPVIALAPSFYAQAPPQVTFAHDIAPIVYRSCAPCHRPGEAGPFSLLTYEDVKKRARQIADLTRSRFMPPWLPEPGHGDFADERRLTDRQIQLISDWVTQGAAEGPASEIPSPPKFTEGWQLGAPDLILEASQPVPLPASGPDIFWNFIFSPNLTTRRYVRAIEIRPGEKRIVHHANLYVDRTQSARRQETTPGAGFPGMDLVIERTVSEPDDGHFLYWKQGGTPYVEPDGLSWSLDPGNDLVLNAHLQTTGKPEQVRPSVGIYFTDKPPEKFPLLVQLEHDGALNIPPGNADFLISDDFRLPVDADVLAVYPHAHYLGHLLEGYATLPDGTRKWLIRIPKWSPTWESVYRYREPLFLPKGSVISMRFHYDNSAQNPQNPSHPPRRVQAGNSVTDEMGHLWLQVLPRGAGDRRREIDEALVRHRLDKYPDDSLAHLRMGALLMAKLNPTGALPQFEAAVRTNPDQAEGHNLFGTALQAVGRLGEAIEQYRAALLLRPDYVNARFNLAIALTRLGKLEEAIEDFRQVLAVYPDDSIAKDRIAKALSLRGKQLAAEGKWEEAIRQYDEALAADPSNAEARDGREAAGKVGPH